MQQIKLPQIIINKRAQLVFLEEKMKKIAILGSTGSIGTQTLEIVRANQDIDVLINLMMEKESLNMKDLLIL